MCQAHRARLLRQNNNKHKIYRTVCLKMIFFSEPSALSGYRHENYAAGRKSHYKKINVRNMSFPNSFPPQKKKKKKLGKSRWN